MNASLGPLHAVRGLLAGGVVWASVLAGCVSTGEPLRLSGLGSMVVGESTRESVRQCAGTPTRIRTQTLPGGETAMYLVYMHASRRYGARSVEGLITEFDSRGVLTKLAYFAAGCRTCDASKTVALTGRRMDNGALVALLGEPIAVISVREPDGRLLRRWCYAQEPLRETERSLVGAQLWVDRCEDDTVARVSRCAVRCMNILTIDRTPGRDDTVYVRTEASSSAGSVPFVMPTPRPHADRGTVEMVVQSIPE